MSNKQTKLLHHIGRHAERIRTFYDGIGNIAVIYPVALLTSFALGLTNLGIVFFARDIFDANPVEIGWLAGTWSIAYAIGCILLRPVLVRFPARYLIIASSFMMFLSVLAIQFVASLAAVFVIFALYGVSMSMFWPPLMAWLSDGHEGSSLGHRFSRYNLMWSFGSIASPYMCGWLAESSARFPLFIGCGIFFASAVFVSGAALVLPKASADISLAEISPEIDEEKQAETLLRIPAWIGLFATFFGLGAIFSIFPLAARSELGIAESSVGLLLLCRALLSAISFYVIGKVVFWHFKIIPMIIAQIMAVVCFVSLYFCSNIFAIGTVFGLLGVFAAFSYATSVFHGVTGSANRVKRMSIHESTLAGGLLGGSVVAGMLYNASSMAHVYLLCAVVLLAGIVIQGIVYAIIHRVNS